MLMKWTKGVKFINFKHANFTYESAFGSFFYLHVTAKKDVCKMLMKLTPLVNFINVKRARFSYESYVLAAFLVTFWLC